MQFRSASYILRCSNRPQPSTNGEAHKPIIQGRGGFQRASNPARTRSGGPGEQREVCEMTVSMRLPVIIAAMALTLAASASAAFAKPPPGVVVDPAVHEWFEGLVRADGVHCCGVGDCRVASANEFRTAASGGGFEVLLNGSWIPVTDEMVIHRENGPLAATIV